MIGARLAGAVGLTVGLAMALAANLTATWPQGSVMIGTGLAAPLVLPLALWIRASFIPIRWCDRAVRELSIVAVAAPAATLSYWHTYDLMVTHGVPGAIAAVLPLSADGIATVSTLALHHNRRTHDHRIQLNRPKTRISRPKVTPAAAFRPSAPPVRTVADEVRSRRTDRTVRVEWLQAQALATWTEQVEALKSEFGVSQSTAKRIIAEAAS